MFERFTEGARRAIFFARGWARQLGSNQIGSEHLLLAILAEEDSAPYLLHPASPEEILSTVKNERCLGQPTSEDSEVPLDDEAKEILKLGSAEADDLQEQEIGNEHLLMGLLKHRKSYAARLLLSRGISPLTVRERLANVRKDPSIAARTNKRPFFPKDSTWQELGIAEGYAGPKLFYNPPSETMIVQVAGNDAEIWHPTRLYMKHKDAARYSQVGDPDEWTSFDSPATSLKQPLLAYNVKAWHKTGDVIGGDWKGLEVLNLKSGIVECSIKTGELISPEQFNDCWVDTPIAISDDGKQIYLTVGLSFLEEDAHRSKIRHVLAVLDLTSKRLEPISTLRGTFF
ncbi:MAG TPA: Clp protease N-terminal domain-containing protein [Terriglobia bacterium]|nr:Clp protease N-terminal domain-containing protein [Terriglobia bacterium]